MPISLIPSKKSKKEVKFKLNKTSRIFIGAILFLLFVFGGLEIYQTSQSSYLENLNKEIAKIDEEMDTEIEKEIQRGMGNLNKVKPLLESRIKAKKVFDFLEKNTFSEVRFSDFNFNTEENELFLQGTTPNALPLIIQNSLLKKLEEVKEVEISGVVISKDGINFQLKLEIDRNFFIF